MTTFGDDNFRPIPVRHSESNQIRYSNDNAVCGIKNLESASFSHLCKSFSAPFLIRASGNLTAELNGVHSFTLISWICFPFSQGLYSWCCSKKYGDGVTLCDWCFGMHFSWKSWHEIHWETSLGWQPFFEKFSLNQQQQRTTAFQFSMETQLQLQFAHFAKFFAI